MEITTNSAEETKALGARIGNSLNGGEVIALVGDLGAGKTTFVQGLAESLGITKRVLSPTFILMREYEVEEKKFDNLYHLDLYRFEENAADELKNLGIEDIWGKLENIVLIEWAEKAQGYFPKETIWIRIERTSEDTRKFNIMNLHII